jgi:anti-sigma factor RsiW
MRCQEMLEVLSADVDGEASSSERETLASHLESCTECQARRDEMASVKRRLRGGIRRETAPAWLHQRVVAQASRPRRSRLGVVLALAGAAAAGALVVVLVRRPAPVAWVGAEAEVLVVDGAGHEVRRHTGDALRAGDLVEAREVPVTLHLGEKARATLLPGAVLRLAEPAAPVSLKNGRAVFTAERGAGELRVTTPGGQVVVAPGTELELSVGEPGANGEAAVLITARRGLVLAIAAGSSVRLAAGERAMLNAGRPPVRLVPSFSPPPDEVPAPISPAVTSVAAAVVPVASGLGSLRGTVMLRDVPREPPPPSCVTGEEPAVEGAALGAVVRLLSPPAGSWPAATVNLTVRGCSVTPRVSVGGVNQPFAVATGDGLPHSLRVARGDFFLPASGAWEQSTGVGPNRSLNTTYAKAGLYSLSCDDRPGDCGYLVVSEHPFVAVTGSDGSFSIDGIPPGHYTVSAWHERTGAERFEVDIGAGKVTNLQAVLKGTGPGGSFVSVDSCRIATRSFSLVGRACAKDGRPGAKRAMKMMVKLSKSAGVRYECSDCHKSDSGYELTANARSLFWKLLATAGRAAGERQGRLEPP